MRRISDHRDGLMYDQNGMNSALLITLVLPIIVIYKISRRYWERRERSAILSTFSSSLLKRYRTIKEREKVKIK